MLRRVAIARAVEGKGHASHESRRAAYTHDLASAPEPVRALLDKVVRHAHRITDDDVAAVRASSTEDEIFELVVCAAYGAASRQLDHALALIDEVG